MSRYCPVCGKDINEILFRVNFSVSNNGLPHYNDIVACSACGFTYANNDASQQVYDNYYQNCNIYTFDNSVKSTVGRDEKIVAIISDMFDRNTRIIDVGFGSGDLLRALKSMKYKNIAGIDPDKDSCRLLESFGIVAYRQSVFDFIGENLTEKFDVVISKCVAEHVYDLNSFFSNQIKMINVDKGYIIVQVPAVEGFEKHYTYFPNYFNQEHINYFSIISLDRLLMKYKFTRVNTDPLFVDKSGEWMIIGVYRHNDSIVDVIERKDKTSKRSIVNYYDLHLKNHKRDVKRVLEFVDRFDSIVLWGCGSYATQLLSETPKIADKIVYCIDSNSVRQKEGYVGKTVYSKEKLIDEPYPVLICSMYNGNDIENDIKNMNIGVDYILV